MAKKDRLPEIAAERGESLDSLIPRLYREYGTYEGVAEDLGVHPNSVRRWRKKHGFTRKPTLEPAHLEVSDVAV